MNILISSDNMNFLEAFSSKTRVKIIEMLNERSMNIGEIAEVLGISSTIVARHIQKLENAGIVASEAKKGLRGIQKLCRLSLDSATLQFRRKPANRNVYTFAIPIGQYTNYKVRPTCGLASVKQYIGAVDDPRYFADPSHVEASILWNSCGFVEYRLPNYLLGSQKLKTIEMTFEICSEAPGYNEDWPSEINFDINGKRLGAWLCPGNFGAIRGVFSPAWWPDSNTGYGLLKCVSVNESGSYLDGIKISDTTIGDLGIKFGEEIILRISSDEDAEICGGFCLLGKGFGNYNQDIEVVLSY